MNQQIKDIINFLKKQNLMRIALLGFVGAIVFSCMKGRPTSSEPKQINIPASSPFKKSISASGFVEANTRNINIGSFSAGIVSDVFVKSGDHVQEGQALFALDSRSASAKVDANKNALEAAQHSIAVAEAKVKETTDQYQRGGKLREGVIAADELKKREFLYHQSLADLKVAEAKAKEAESNLKLAQVELDKLTVKAPFAGLICKVNIQVGEYIGGIDRYQTYIVMGGDNPLHVRAQIDENDIWRFEKNLQAVAFIPSHSEDSIKLKFVRLEPYANPKQNLSGDSRERVDTRVVEIIYAVEGTPKYNIYIGQQVDVFIEDIN